MVRIDAGLQDGSRRSTYQMTVETGNQVLDASTMSAMNDVFGIRPRVLGPPPQYDESEDRYVGGKQSKYPSPLQRLQDAGLSRAAVEHPAQKLKLGDLNASYGWSMHLNLDAMESCMIVHVAFWTRRPG